MNKKLLPIYLVLNTYTMYVIKISFVSTEGSHGVGKTYTV